MSRDRVENDPKFVASGHHNNDLKTLCDRYPEGVPAHIEARALMQSERSVAMMWARIVRKLRTLMGA